MNARIAEALVDLREAGGVVVTLRTCAGEAVDAIDTGSAVAAGVAGTLVNVDVTHGAWKEGEEGLLYFLEESYNIYANHTMYSGVQKFGQPR